MIWYDKRDSQQPGIKVAPGMAEMLERNVTYGWLLEMWWTRTESFVALMIPKYCMQQGLGFPET